MTTPMFSPSSSSVQLPAPAPLLTRTGWTAFIVALIVVCAVAPALNLWVPAGSPLHLSDYAVALLGKIMCYAICALAMDLIWGYTGILSLGHGLFFALGGYVMGMYLMRQIGRDGNYQSDLPDFMVFLDWKELPWHWALSDSFIATLVLIVAVPGLVAFVFGYFAFRSRIKGVYFSIITQAMTYAAMLLFFRNETGFGGNNGFTDFKRILGQPIATPTMRMLLFVLTGLTLLGFFLLGRWLVRSKFGRVLQAVRDAETRVMFSGYSPLPYKLTIWTISAMMCGVAGALYVPQVGIINPGEMSAANSIEIAVWAAVGGRATLIGPIVGAFLVNGAKSWLTVTAPEFWLYFLGALFIAVTLFLPNGVVGLLRRSKKEAKAAAAAAAPTTGAVDANTESLRKEEGAA
ncbi:urea ABC transporter permease subunit UrtC [Paracidovorax wautersii]|uniref:urea ABC transporter permease subunit UrtC n=1 Tax=Paracidovorax wautersii TaxID=1177982 RepID=UPI0031DB93B9